MHPAWMIVFLLQHQLLFVAWWVSICPGFVASVAIGALFWCPSAKPESADGAPAKPLTWTRCTIENPETSQGMLTKLSLKEQGYLYRGPAAAEGEGEKGEENRVEEIAWEAALRREGAEGEGGGGGGGGGGGRKEGEPVTSRITAPPPAPSSSSSSSGAVVAGEWAHATHGRSPPLQPSPSPLRPPPPCVR